MEISFDLDDLSNKVAQYISENALSNPAMIGIHTGGAWLAQVLHRRLKLNQPLGTLDISFYRDDLARNGLSPVVRPSNLPFNVEGQHILLVDDVLYTGRTIRAAMNEIFDYGRPASITLVVLAERDGRELPVQATIAGSQFTLNPSQQIKLSGPEPLKLEILES